MISFRPGPVPHGVSVGAPAWPDLRAAVQPAAPHRSSLPVPAAAKLSDPVTEARLEAARILQEAAAEAELAMAEARQQGFATGRQEGLAAAATEVSGQVQVAQQEADRAKTQAALLMEAAEAGARARRAEAEAEAQVLLAQAREKAEALLHEAGAEQNRQLEAAHHALVELAVAAAVRLVQGHLTVQPHAIAAMVASGLRRLKDTHCTVRTRPQDLPLLEAQRGALERELGAGLLVIKPDSSLSVGSYMIDSPRGHIDATLEQQSVGLRAALVEAMGGE